MENLINKKSIAILLAVYNGEKYLSEQIDSVISQTNQDWTLYIRDDASTDNTCNIIDRYCEKYSNIIAINDDKGNLGCSGNFFQLLEVVESDYYMFCDGDDVWLAEKVEISFAKIRELEKTYPLKPIVVHTDTALYNENMELIAESNWKLKKLNPDLFSTPNLLPICPCVGGATMLFNLLAKKASLPLNGTLSMYDSRISIQVIKTGIVHAIHIPLLKYRQHSNNVFGAFGGNLDKKMNFFFKLRLIIKSNMGLYRKVKSNGYGSFLKFIYYKFKVQLIMKKIYKNEISSI